MKLRLAIAFFSAAFAACSSDSSCLPAIPTATSCGDGVFVDASTSDPICVSAGGLPICRGDYNAICYICSGANFTDNCLIRDKTGQTTECVHNCSRC